MTERITYVEIDLERCSNRYGVVGTYPDPNGNVTYPNAINEMPSPFDPSGWTGASDPDGAIVNTTISNPSGFNFAGLAEQVGAGFFFLNSAVSPVTAGEMVGLALICKEDNFSADIEFNFAFDSNPNIQGRFNCSTGEFSGNPLISTRSTKLDDGFLLLESIITAPYTDTLRARFVLFDRGAGIPSSGSSIYVQSSFFGRTDDFPALVGFPSNCTASIPTTGDKKCFNCLATCQDRPNYAQEIVTERYSTATSNPPLIDAIPSVASVDFRPAKLDLGESIGLRASVGISFKDHRFPDTGPSGDYYLSDRNYDPYKQGTYWGKWRARFPFYKSWDIRVIRGVSDQSIEQMETRHFIIDKVTGPDSNGNFSISCKDALKLADRKKAQAPILGTGTLVLPISETDTVIEPSDFRENYPIGQYINIAGDEIVRVDSYLGNPLDNKIGVTRGQFNTEAKAHDSDVRLQLCLYYFQQKPSFIINDLLDNYANVPPEYTPENDWEVEDDTYVQRTYTALIAEPTSVTDLVNEILQQTASSLWWDDEARLLKWRVLRAVDSNAALYNDDLIVSGTFSAKDQPEKRVSQVWTYYGQLNPTVKLDEENNYTSSLLTISTESEANYGEPSIKRIFSRWITSAGSDAADRLNKLILSRYTTPPRMLSWSLQKNDTLIEPQLGGGYNVENFTIQDDTGLNQVIPAQAVQVKSTDTNYVVMAEEVLYTQTVAPDDPNVKPISIDSNRNNVNLIDLYAEAGFGTPQSTDIVNINISSGVIIGSSSTGEPALVTGAGWPVGAEINLTNNGTITGKGGAGGAGGGSDIFIKDVAPKNGGNGENGGKAISASFDFNLTNNGTIQGGGGGGGGGGAAAWLDVDVLSDSPMAGGGGGGAGAGTSSSTGGLGGIAEETDYVSNGADGSSSSTFVGGAGGAGGIATRNFTVAGGLGGTGGLPAQNGQDGQDGSVEQGADFALGGTGGIAGDAINKNGYTVNISGSGNILGAITP